MKDGDKLQRQFDQLASGFLAPLLRGETVELEQALAPGAIHYFEHATPAERVDEIDIYDGLHRAAHAIAPIASVPWPSRDLVLLTMAAYNLALVTDPTLDRTFARSARFLVLRWVDEIVDLISPPTRRADALSRHALLAPFAALRRRDVKVKNWAYTYRFKGRPVPANVVAMPRTRMVRRFDDLVPVGDLWQALEKQDDDLVVGRRLRSLLSRSPVTEIIRPDLCPHFRFGWAALSCLSDDALRGGVARALVDRGEWAMAKVLGAAIGDRELRHAPAAMLYYALALVFEVQMTATFDVPGPNLPEQLDLTDPDVARFAAVVPAFFDDETMLDEVRAFHPEHRADAQARSARLRALLPPATLNEVAVLVRRCQRPGREATGVTTSEETRA